MVMCTDLDKYVKEVDPIKKSLLLVNKADLLTNRQRCRTHLFLIVFLGYSLPVGSRYMWARYFHSQGLRFLFWSANYERLRQEAREEELRRLQEEAGDFEAGDSQPASRQKQHRRPEDESSEEEDEDEEAEEEAEENKPGDEGPASNDEREAEDDDEGGEEEAENEDDGANASAAEPSEADAAESESEKEQDKETQRTETETSAKGELSDEEVERLSKVHGIDELLQFLLDYCPPKQSTFGQCCFV